MSVAFGCQAKRFDFSGVHPNYKLPGKFLHITDIPNDRTNVAPGSYDITKSGDAFNEINVQQRSAKTAGWDKQLMQENESKRPHLLYIGTAKEQASIRDARGPTTYHVQNGNFGTENQRPPSTQGPKFSRARRFTHAFTSSARSCPGTYGTGGVPHAAFEAASKRAVTSLGIMDSGMTYDRSLPLTGTDLAPGRYEFKSFTDGLKSKRGPMDMVTGSHSKKKKKSGLGPGHYKHASFTDALVNGLTGKFSSLQRDGNHGERVWFESAAKCPPGGKLGPGSYNAMMNSGTSRQTFNTKSTPFLSGQKRETTFVANSNPVGVGRYSLQRKYHVPVAAVMKSVTPRFLDSKSTFYFNERIRSKDTQFSDYLAGKSIE